MHPRCFARSGRNGGSVDRVLSLCLLEPKWLRSAMGNECAQFVLAETCHWVGPLSDEMLHHRGGLPAPRTPVGPGKLMENRPRPAPRPGGKFAGPSAHRRVRPGLARERKGRTFRRECVQVSGRVWVSWARLLKCVGVLGYLRCVNPPKIKGISLQNLAEIGPEIDPNPSI